MASDGRILLSPPWVGGDEEALLLDALRSGWLAPLGPQVDAFEEEFAQGVGAPHAVALSSGTAALHLALLLAGVGAGDRVFVSTLTFAASAFPVRYVGATPYFIDSERVSWNMDPALLAEALEADARRGRLPKAVIVVHLYGQPANLEAILATCAEYGVPVLEDAAEALGSTHRAGTPGTQGALGVFSFNGNKIITTSGGGMLVTRDAASAVRARKLAAQAREPVLHYEHLEVGYNYRMSNLLAAVGRAQFRTLAERVERRSRTFEGYRAGLDGVHGVELMPEAPWGRHSRWLTTLTVDPRTFGASRDEVITSLAADGVEARPVWKPLHKQPVFAECGCAGGAVAEALFEHGVCLPSGPELGAQDVERVVAGVRGVVG